MAQNVKIGEFFLQKPREDRYNRSEVAAWWERIRFEPQIADAMATIGERNGKKYVEHWGYRLDGTIVDEYHASLFGGVPIGPYEPKDIGKKTSHSFGGYGYNLGELLIQGGKMADGIIIPTVDLHVTAESYVSTGLFSALVPNPKCTYCGGVLRHATPEEREAVENTLDRPDYLHTDGQEAEEVCEHKRADTPEYTGSYGWPAKDQWRKYTPLGALHTLWLGPKE